MNTTQEKIEVMQACLDGKEIEIVPRGFSEWVTALTSPLWNWDKYDYRVKPDEPKFKVGDWVRHPLEPMPFKWLERMNNNSSEINNDCELWEPRDGDVVVCWDNTCRTNKRILKIKNNDEHLVFIKEFDNCIPYIGQKWEEMK